MTLPLLLSPEQGVNSASPSLLCAFGCGFGSVPISPQLGRSRAQVTVAGTSLSCRTWGRKAGGSELLQREEEALSSSGAVWPYPGDGAHEEFSSCSPAHGLLFNNPPGNKLHFLGEGKPEKRKKREKEKENNQIVKAAEITLSEV